MSKSRQSVIEVFRQGDSYIVTIGHEDSKGQPLGGYRMAGPKFIYGDNVRILRHVVDEHEAAEIRRFLPRRASAKNKKGR